MISTQPSLSLTPSQSVQKSPKWDMECCNYYPNPHPYLSTVSVVFLQNQKLTMPKRNSNSLSLLFAFLNGLGKQAVSPSSIKQRVEIALLFLYVCFLRQTVSTL